MVLRAECLIRSQPQYRATAFKSGLVAAGYQLANGFAPKKGDVLVIWNRYGHYHRRANEFENAGGTVLIAENGYLGRDYNKEHWYALSLNRHNTIGNRHRVGRQRQSSIAAGFCPGWRQGDAVLLLPQRGIGVPPAAQPNDWLARMMRTLRTDRPVIVRQHPGEKYSHHTLYDDLQKAWCVITWGSGGGIKAIHAGVPVFYGYHGWIGQRGAKLWDGDVENPYLGSKDDFLEDVHAGMFRLDEISSGWCFEQLLCGIH